MAQAQGYRSQLAFDIESSFAVTPTTPAGINMPIQTSKIKSKQNMIEDKTIRGRRDPAQPALGNIDVSGQIQAPLDEVAIGYWLKAMFGSPTTTGAAAPYNHVFKPGFIQPSLVLEQGFPDIGKYFLYNGCKVNKFSISFGGDQELTAQIDIMGAKETIASASFDSTLTQIVLQKFSNFQASIMEGGASIGTVTKADLNIDFGLDGDTYVIGGQGFRGSVNEGIMNVSGSITALFDSTALLDKAIAGTETSILLQVSSANGHSLEFKMPEVMYERNSPSIDGPKGVLVDLNYRAYYRANADNAAIITTLINDQATY